MRRILVVQSHPDASKSHYCHALAEAYRRGAHLGGHEVREIDLGRTDIPLLRSKLDWETPDVAPDFVRSAQSDIEWANHIVFIFPLWLGGMPALLSAWLEHVLRPEFAFKIDPDGKSWNANLGGRSARVIVTMGMPSLLYRWFYFSHSLRRLKRNILAFCGIRPVRHSLIGLIESQNPKPRSQWLARIEHLGKLAR